MAVSRRRFLHSVSLTGVGVAAAQQPRPAAALDPLRNVSAAYGIDLNEDRLRILQPVLARRFTQLRTLRDFDIDDAVAPTRGVLAG
jgi:hypothetical protein